MTPNYIFIASRAPLIKLPHAHITFECSALLWNVDFILNLTNIRNSIFFFYRHDLFHSANMVSFSIEKVDNKIISLNYFLSLKWSHADISGYILK